MNSPIFCEKNVTPAMTPGAPSASPAETATTERDTGYDMAAYYWPAHHDESRWRQFMPDGEGEWEIIRRATPKFEGHRQPRVPTWGYENEACPAVMEKKIAAAVNHGVNVWIFDWYWYENSPFLEGALNEGFLQAKNNSQIKFFIMWANHNATTLWDFKRSHEPQVIWPGAVDRASFDTATNRIIQQYFPHPSYYRIDGKPVFSIYELGTLIKGLGGVEKTREALDAFRAAARAAGFPGIHLQAILWSTIPAGHSQIPGDSSKTQANTITACGIDSLTNYQWVHSVWPENGYQEWGDTAITSWEKWAAEFPVPFYPHVSIGWDNNPRYTDLRKGVIKDSTPDRFGEFLGKAVDFVDRHRLEPRLITINSWNEWSEGSYLEPDTVHGMGYLEAVKKIVTK